MAFSKCSMADLGALSERVADLGEPRWGLVDVCPEVGGAVAEGPAPSSLTSSWETWDLVLVWVNWGGRAWEGHLLEGPATGAAVDEGA